MNRLAIPIVAVAFLAAACGTAGGSSGSAGLRDTTNVGAVRVSQGANADSEADVNRVNPPITKGTRSTPVVPAQPQTAVPSSGQPSLPVDRCNGDMGSGQGAGNRSSTGSVKHPPLPACAMQ